MQPADTPLLINDREAARLSGISRASWWRLFAAAKTPSATKLGRSRRWNRAEVIFWIEQKCPDRRTLESLKGNRRLKVS